MNQRITQQQTNTNSETLEQQKSNSWIPMGPTKDRANLTETFMPEPSLSLRPIGVQLKRSANVLTVIRFITKHAVGHITFESRIKFVIVTSIEFWKHFTEFVIPITLFEKFRCKNLISGVKVSDMTRHSSKPISCDRCSKGISPSKNGKFSISKSKSSRLS